MSKKKRLKKIWKVLAEMGAGRFYYHIEKSSKKDSIDAIISGINMMAEEIGEALIHQGYVNSNETIKHIVLMNFQIDLNGKIKAVNPQACEILYYPCEEMVGQSFDSFLNEKSVPKWERLWNQFRNKKMRDSSLELTFRTKHGLIVPSACYINTLGGKTGEMESLIVTVVKHSKRQVELEEYLIAKEKNSRENPEKDNPVISSIVNKRKVILTSSDIAKIRQVRNYFTENLERDFPPITQLAREFGTNTFKIKYGFKELYGVSVFNFIRNERLRKAKILVEGTNLTFKKITQLCGFKSVPSFSATFKNEFGYTPKQLRRKFNSENS
ncbi:MAG: helix-turn-helix domain-containing protein [bacterium]|nr:helix-turn-helix domain-containing protein [bacterium]